MRFGLVLIALGAFGAPICPAYSADIQILARCGESNGSSYYFEGGIVGPGLGGWKADEYKNGRITPFLNENEQADIMIKDSSGIRIYLHDGMKMALTTFDDKSLSFIVFPYSNKSLEAIYSNRTRPGLERLSGQKANSSTV